jgi:hypothetical protein
VKCGCASCGKVKTIWRLGYCLDCLGERCGKAEAAVERLRGELSKIDHILPPANMHRTSGEIAMQEIVDRALSKGGGS